MNIPDTKTAVDKEVGEAQKIISMANRQSKDQKKGHPRGTEGAKNSPFCYADGHLKNVDLEQTFQKYKRRVTPR